MDWENHLKKPIQKIEKTVNIKVKLPHMNKKSLAKKKFGSNKKLGIELTMNGLGKPFKKANTKNRKNSKHQSEIAACEQKITSEKEIWFKQKTRHRINYEWIGKTI